MGRRSWAVYIRTHGIPCENAIWQYLKRGKPLDLALFHRHWYWKRDLDLALIQARQNYP
jgi:hypothetical protein